jgi:ribonuclease HI
LRDWLLTLIGRLSDVQTSWFFILIYNLWMARNDARESGKIEDPVAIVRRTALFIEELCNLNAASSTSPISVEKWVAPDHGWCKVNTDGAFRKEDHCGGGGVVIRDHHGSFIAGASRFFPHTADPESAELLACRQGLVLAREAQVAKVILETDCASVKTKLSSAELDRSFNASLVEEVKEVLRSFDESLVHAVRRSANGAAHVLAKNGCENKLDLNWLGVPPACVVNSLDMDVLV